MKRKRNNGKVYLVIAIVLIALFMIGFSNGTSKGEVKIEKSDPLPQRAEYVGIVEYEVKSFDTLSKIACDYIPSDRYMETWIRDVQKLNGRKNSTIYFGEVIKVYECKK